MAEVKCAECGVTADGSTEGWTHCEECGADYCPHCSGKFRQEKEDIEGLKQGGPYERMRILCPSCGVEMGFLDHA